MEKSFKLLSVVVILLFLGGCFSTKSHSALNKTPAKELLEPYQGPQAKISINDFELKTSGADAQVSLALKEYLVSVLHRTKRFTIVAPQEADLIINVGIVEFIPENSGGKSGLAGGGSSASGFMGGLLGEVLNKANMQLSLRIIDRVTSAVISSRDIQSQVVEHPGKKIKFPQDKAFRNGFTNYVDTPMGKVIYDCIIEAGSFIVQNVPQNYYKG
ncbi:MAG: CsgG/HfaB family protein [Candidatus Omnitrophica bacterium]|nr:CsgG/HfaB family protein [Candidatus Omnitrophota bacterium]